MAGSCGKRSAQRLQHHRHPGASRSASNRDRPTPCRGAAGADTLAAMEHQPLQRPRGRGIYLLPNLFTTGGLFGGFFAIIAASQGRFEAACVAIFIAAILDGLDGRVARLTNTQSEFGVQYDSLAELISFGMAPALVMYHWALVSLKLDGGRSAEHTSELQSLMRISSAVFCLQTQNTDYT